MEINISADFKADVFFEETKEQTKVDSLLDYVREKSESAAMASTVHAANIKDDRFVPGPHLGGTYDIQTLKKKSHE